eukprot:GILI01021702.1.p1 GENE.GILI01021702.1~~GILI01021702.1.p1  ORF type:complete len:311 (+),score=67.90 GILI01021702.1:60-935(+)
MGGGAEQKSDWRDLALGGGIQCCEAITLGMPFEVWKTQQISSIRTGKIETVGESFSKLWSGGIGRFYKGSSAKLAESFMKGGVLFFTSQITKDLIEEMGVQRTSSLSDMIGGFFGGVSQTVVMSPMTYVVTYKNAHPTNTDSTIGVLRKAGFKGMFSSAPAMAMRQGSNWALRFLFAKEVNNQYRKVKGAPLNTGEQIICGMVGGAMGCINQPAEVLRVVVQSRHAKGETNVTTRNSASMVYKNFGFAGFYTGVIPRMGLSAWQTLFMFTFAGMVRDSIRGPTSTTTKAGH